MSGLDDLQIDNRNLVQLNTLGVFAGGLLNGGDDEIYGEAFDGLLAGDAFVSGGSGTARGGDAIGGNDRIVGDNDLSLDLHLSGLGEGLFGLGDSLLGLGVGLDGGFLNGGHDFLVGDASLLNGGSFGVSSGSGEVVGGRAIGGDDWIAGDHNLKLILDLSHGGGGLSQSGIVDIEDVETLGVTSGILNGGNDLIAGDAISDISFSDGGDDTLIGDHNIELTLSLPHHYSRGFETGSIWSVSGVSGLNVEGGFANGGNDEIYGDTNANLFGFDFFSGASEEGALDSRGGDDQLIGDHNVKLQIEGHGEGGGFGSLGLDGGFGRGGDDNLVGDSGALLLGGFISSSKIVGPVVPRGIGGDDWVVGDHNLDLYLSYYLGEGFGWLGSGGNDLISGDTNFLGDFGFGGDDVLIGDHHIVLHGGVDYGAYESNDAWAAAWGNGAPFEDGDDYITGDAGATFRDIDGSPDTGFGGEILGTGEIDGAIAGNDTIYGDSVVHGGRAEWDWYGGSDRIFGDTDGNIIGDSSLLPALDSSYGGMVARGGNDTLFGGGGEDSLYGDAGDRIINAIAGDDWIFGGHGDDFAVGDAGNGSFDPFLAFERSIFGNDDLWGEEGNDRLIGDVGSFGFKFVGSDEPFEIDDREGSLKGQTGGDDLIYGGKGDDGIIGDVGRDIFDATLESDFGGTPDTTISIVFEELPEGTGEGVGGNDTLIGGKGNDLIIGDAGSFVNRGGLGGDDLLQGDEGNDLLVGDAGIGIGSGGAGGNDILVGGSGDDELIGDANDDIEDGGEDSTGGIGGNDLLIAGSGHDILYGDARNDVDNSIGGDDTLKGEEGDDTLYGDAGGDVENGAVAGDDLLFGGSGDDLLVGDGGVGVDSFGGDDMLFGGMGDDTLIGDSESEIEGIAGDDLLDGGKGDDILYGDSMSGVTLGGDTGSDTFVAWLTGNGDDRIKDFEFGIDTLLIADVFDANGDEVVDITDLMAAGASATGSMGNILIEFGDGSVVVENMEAPEGALSFADVADLLGGNLEIEASTTEISA